MKTLTNYINESRELKYRVQFINSLDEEGLPISGTILIDSKDQDEFEEYLKNEQDNVFAHASGGRVEY